MTITEFLLARIAEDEAVTRDYRDLAGAIRNQGMPTVADWLTEQGARVLAECEAKRRIVERHSACGTGAGYCDDGGHGWGEDDEGGPGCGDLADLASVYADHQDFDPAWRA